MFPKLSHGKVQIQKKKTAKMVVVAKNGPPKFLTHKLVIFYHTVRVFWENLFVLFGFILLKVLRIEATQADRFMM